MDSSALVFAQFYMIGLMVVCSHGIFSLWIGIPILLSGVLFGLWAIKHNRRDNFNRITTGSYRLCATRCTRR